MKAAMTEMTANPMTKNMTEALLKLASAVAGPAWQAQAHKGEWED